MTRARSAFEILLHQAHTLDEDTGARVRVGSTPWFIPETPGLAQWTDDEIAAGAYGDESGPELDQEPESLRAIPTTAIEDIARELDLAACRTVEELKGRRRQFARDNHPDVLHGSLKAAATERMMIANRLIDGEIQRRRIASR